MAHGVGFLPCSPDFASGLACCKMWEIEPGAVMDKDERAQRTAQRAARDKQLDDITTSLDRASKLIEDSQREIRRSRDLMRDQQEQNQRDDQAEDRRGE